MYRRLISVKQAAALLSISVITISRMIKAGKIEARKLGRRVLIDPEVLGLKEIPEKPEIKMPDKIEVNMRNLSSNQS